MAARDVRNEAGMSLGDLYGVMRRRRAWFLVPTVLGVVASLVLALTLPAEYEAAATVTVEPPVIPDKLAPNTIASDTETRYENLKLQLLARDSLSSIITDFNLFEGATSAREVQVEEMRQRISIAPLPPAIAITQLTAEPQALELLPSEPGRITLRALRADGSTGAPENVTWRSSRPSIVGVSDSSGGITAICSGVTVR